MPQDNENSPSLAWLRAAADRALSALEHLVIEGPDPIDLDEPPGALEALLPWPVRLLVVFGLWAVARIWYDSAAAQQLAWALSYVGAILVSLMASWWFVLLVANLLLGLAWLGLTFARPPNRQKHPLLWLAQQLVEFLNRQLSHAEALFVWTAFLLSLRPRVDWQLPALAALYLLAPPFINGLAHASAREHGEGARPRYLSKHEGRLQSARRPYIYGATLLGIALLVLRTLDAQIWNLLPLAVAVSAGAALRWKRHRVRTRRADPGDADVKEFRRVQRRITRNADIGLGPGLVVVALIALFVVSVRARAKLDAHERAALDGPAAPVELCAPEPGGPRAADVRVLLAADSQLHELAGERFPGQLELADAVVPVALRPVELDMLSAAPLYRYARYFNETLMAEAAPAPKDGAPLTYWAHLGDLGDLSCRGEVERAIGLLKQFSALAPEGREPARLAGLAVGNHDMSFTGNFFWSPFWSDACPSSPLEKAASMKLVAGFAKGLMAPGGEMVPVREGGLPPPWVWGRGGALVGVTPLGPIKACEGARGPSVPCDRVRGLGAIFVDTADGEEFDQGIAGLNGTFSASQAEKLRALVTKTMGHESGLYRDPVWLIFAHHPMAEMMPDSLKRLYDFVAWLDEAGREGEGEGASSHRPRTLAIITAHTHQAETHRHCVGGRALREIVIGSTTDPPQQAALLEAGSDARGVPSVRVRTIPSVVRDGFACGAKSAGSLDAGVCRRVVARLKNTPACEALFQPEDGLARDCAELEKPTSLTQRLVAVTGSRGPIEPKKIKNDQKKRASKLLACVCRPREGGKGEDDRYCKAPAGDVFKDEAYHEAILERLRADEGVRRKRVAEAGGEAGGVKVAEGGEPDGVDELACLSWAAAAVQSHKASGMTFSEALRCAFDDRSLPAAQESTASLEARACH
jgi:hypothetical protein